MKLKAISQNSTEGQRAWGVSSYFSLDATIPVQQQNINATYDYGSGSTNLTNVTLYLSLCYYLKGPDNIEYLFYETPSPRYKDYKCPPGGSGPLPPTPVPQPISCKVNNGNSLSVDLGTLDRANIPTVPGTGDIRSVSFPVTCTNGSASMKMQLNYTPITVSGSQVVNSSINGLGVAVSYNDKILAPSDVTTKSFSQGTSNVTLKFEAVRNPSVAVSDIKTGPFTASAVLVMTQQ
ncbi:fimbrial protein [Franconibacter daqui]|uniref:Fimbrial protein n=1 Tax=Franconibacter daqui TaxID=2047724 RepID=A0ABV1PU00_9ENTR